MARTDMFFQPAETGATLERPVDDPSFAHNIVTEKILAEASKDLKQEYEAKLAELKVGTNEWLMKDIAYATKQQRLWSRDRLELAVESAHIGTVALTAAEAAIEEKFTRLPAFEVLLDLVVAANPEDLQATRATRF